MLGALKLYKVNVLILEERFNSGIFLFKTFTSLHSVRVRQCQLNFEMLKWIVAAELSPGRAGMPPSCEIFLKFFARSSHGIQTKPLLKLLSVNCETRPRILLAICGGLSGRSFTTVWFLRVLLSTSTMSLVLWAGEVWEVCLDHGKHGYLSVGKRPPL